MSPSFDDPALREEADKVRDGAKAIIDAVSQHGPGTTTTMIILGELMKMMPVGIAFLALPEGKRDDFFAEVWDSCIGEEEKALVNHLGFVGPAALEKVSDALKGVALSYFNLEVESAINGG
jgi:hypothetical protein